MPNILIVSENKGYLATQFTENLEKLSYRVSLISNELGAIGEAKGPLGGVLIFVDEKLLGEQAELEALLNRAAEDDAPIFTLGSVNDLEAISKRLPEQLLLKEFPRPLRVHVDELTAEMDRLLKERGKRNSILLVDDSGQMLRSVKEWLEDKYRIALANSGASAMKYLEANRPDLVLLDYEMPDADGKEVLQRIRAERYPDIPVMFLTVKGDRESVLNVKDLKPQGYLLKTMEPAQIVKAVDDFFLKRNGGSL